MQVKHQTFNPQWAGLDALCANMEKQGFMLSHIVPSTQYQAVAIFVKPDPPEEDRETVIDSAGRLREIDDNSSYL